MKLIRADGNNKRVSYGFDHARRETVRTDFFEHNSDSVDAERSVQVRRLVYHMLAAVGGVVNPLEPWHFGFVDLNDPTCVSDGLTARSTGATHRFYDSVPGMPDADQSLQDQLNNL